MRAAVREHAERGVGVIKIMASGGNLTPGTQRRFQLFESVRKFLVDAAAGTGLLMVFDDVHWAGAPSLRLLRHLATGIGSSRLLLLVIYRDTETGGGWCFSHDLIRDTALLELPTAARLAIHTRMADHLMGQPDAAPAVIAHHLLESLPLGEPALAARWAERAAEAAMAQLAGKTPLPSTPVRCAPPPARDRQTVAACCATRAWPSCAASTWPPGAARCGRRPAPRAAGDPHLIGEVALAMEGFTDPAWVPPGQAALRRGAGRAARRRQPAAGHGCSPVGPPRPPTGGSPRPGRCPGRR